MDFYEVIEKRRTIRIFKAAATEEQLRRIILAGSKAPSGSNRQPWEFILIDDPQIINQVAELKYKQNRKMAPGTGETQKEVDDRARNQQKWFQNSGVVSVCTISGQSLNGWLAVENMSLAAVAEGLGSNIIGFAGDEKKEVERILGLPADYELTCVLKFGVPAEVSAPKRRPDFSWFHKNKF